jgi:DnaJ-class molecular chaperone
VITPYTVLGVPSDADAEMVRAAFRKAAKRYHPDLHPGDPAAERRFRRLLRARNLLLDPARGSAQVMMFGIAAIFGSAIGQHALQLDAFIVRSKKKSVFALA